MGITGVPGVGKSTFIEKLWKTLTALGKKKLATYLLLILAALFLTEIIFVDKTRMEELVKDKTPIYIRPSASGDTMAD
jgi:LAO/AO transport system kinase